MKIAGFVAALLLVGCPRDPVPPTPDADSGVVVVDAGTATCASWCKHASEMHCNAAKPTPEGASCETVCENLQGSGLVKFDLKCRSVASSCMAAEACEKSR